MRVYRANLHVQKARERYDVCRYCGAFIVWDPSRRGRNGRPMPLDKNGTERHNCLRKNSKAFTEREPFVKLDAEAC